MTLDDSTLASRRSFPLVLLFVPVLAASLIAGFYVCIHIFDMPYFGPPHWFCDLKPVSYAVAIIGIFSSLLALCIVPFRHRNRRQLVVVVIVSVMCLFSGAVIQSLALKDLTMAYRDLPYQRMQAAAGGLSKAAYVYASDNGGHFPPHLAVMLLEGGISPRALADFDLPRYELPNPPPPISDWRSIAADVDARSAYVYVAADLSDSPDTDPRIIMLYTRPARVIPRHRLVAFSDTHVELIDDADFPKYFAASNAARAQLHLPALSIDVPPPLAPATVP